MADTDHSFNAAGVCERCGAGRSAASLPCRPRKAEDRRTKPDAGKQDEPGSRRLSPIRQRVVFFGGMALIMGLFYKFSGRATGPATRIFDAVLIYGGSVAFLLAYFWPKKSE